MMSAVIEHETSAATPRTTTMQPAAVTPMLLLQQALAQGVDTDKLAALMSLQERWEANEARKAFVTAMNAFKANPPRIEKNKEVDYTTSKGRTNYMHATLDNVCDVIGAALAKVGISHRWQTEQNEAGLIRVTCILTHALGHSENCWLQAAKDESGGKNSIQGVGSTITYLERYSLLAATGMATAHQDDDGAGTTEGETERIAKFVADWSAKFDEASTEAELKEARTKSREAAKEFGDDAETMYLALRSAYARRLEAIKPA